MFIGAFGGDRIRKCPTAQSPAALESLPVLSGYPEFKSERDLGNAI